MKNLKETLPTFSKEKNLILIVAIALMIIFIIIMLYLTFGEKVTLQFTRVQPFLIKYKKKFTTTFSQEILTNPKFNNLKKYGSWPVKVGQQGRDNPFSPFIEPPEVEEVKVVP